MFPLDVFIPYTPACILLVISPGPDNLMAIGRGLSQGKLAAVVSGSSAATGFFSAALNPKPGLFVLAFIPQFINPDLSSVTIQMFGYGIWFALLTTLGFSLMGIFASQLSGWLKNKPKVVSGLNIRAGVTFISSGLAVAFMRQR